MHQLVGGKMGGKTEENEGNQVESVKEKSHWPHTYQPHVHAFITLLINSQLINGTTFISGTIKHFSTLMLMRWLSPLLLRLFLTCHEIGSVCVASNTRSNDGDDEIFL